MGSGADNIEEFMGEEQTCTSNLETITIPIINYKKMLIVAEKYRELVNEHAELYCDYKTLFRDFQNIGGQHELL